MWINSTLHKNSISVETSVRMEESMKQELMLYITATEKTKKSDEVKSSILLSCIGLRGRKVNNTFVFDDDSMKMNFNKIYNNLMIIASLKKCDFLPIHFFHISSHLSELDYQIFIVIDITVNHLR